MSRKYELISELYDRTCKTVVSNPQNWQNFLQSACRNYKLRYDEQLLIYAQRPDATAVLEIERWNRSFGRWVNKGARGIAVFADENRARQRLTHYFDISDTHESRYSRPVPLWDMRDEYTDDVIETLESTFGELDNKVTLGDAVMSAAQNAAEDNLPDYLNDLIYASEDSFLEGLDETMIASLYKKVVTNSVAYMMMTRLGIDTGEYFEADDFRDVTNFNTQDTMNALGFATSDIAEMGLSEISKTVMALNRQNRIIEANRQLEYNKDIKDERSSDYERDNIHDGRGLQSSEPDSARTAGGHSGQVVADEENLSERTPQGSVLQSPDERDTEQSSVGSSAEGDRTGGNAYQTDGRERGTDGAAESERYDEMGSPNEQYQELGTGNREGTSNIRLEYYDRSNEDKSLPFFGGDDTIREILGTTPHLSASLEDIKDFYERNTDSDTRTEYIKSIFNNDYTELTLQDGRTVGYKTFQNVLHLWKGHYDSRTAQSFYNWSVIAQHFEAIRELLELLKKNAMKEQANDVFEICSYVDGLEKKIDSMTEELTNMQNQIKEMQEDTLVNNAKKALSEAQERLNSRCEHIKSQVLEVKEQVRSTAKGIVEKAKEKGRAALYRVSEFLGIKKRLLDIRENVRGAIKTTDKDIAKTALLAKEFREAGQTAANAFRTFADKPEVDYSQKEQKHPITKAVLAPMKAVKKMLVSMKLHLDASIDKLDNLAIDVRMDKEKHMENAKVQEQTEPERAEAERVEAEIVYSPMVAEPQEYQYNADAFEARGVDEVKQEAAHKEVSKVREDKAR